MYIIIYFVTTGIWLWQMICTWILKCGLRNKRETNVYQQMFLFELWQLRYSYITFGLSVYTFIWALNVWELPQRVNWFNSLSLTSYIRHRVRHISIVSLCFFLAFLSLQEKCELSLTGNDSLGEILLLFARSNFTFSSGKKVN